MMDIYAKLKLMGLELPPPPPPNGSYVSVKQVGNLIFTAGALPSRNGVYIYTGKVGYEVSPEQAQ
ncbi:MAG: RidA family protein, partial [Deferribacteraceae bacterium]|nr:RidA family protein [Deferribacteraceae bacterium]